MIIQNQINKFSFKGFFINSSISPEFKYLPVQTWLFAGCPIPSGASPVYPAGQEPHLKPGTLMSIIVIFQLHISFDIVEEIKYYDTQPQALLYKYI